MTSDRQAMVIKFLNEVDGDFPSAISLAAGRPAGHFSERMGLPAMLDATSLYNRHRATTTKDAHAEASLLQYGPTVGIVNDLVAEQLRIDEGVPAASDRIVITCGCQEALTLCISALCKEPGDVLLACNPTYAGAIGAARASAVEVHSIPGATSNLAAGIAQAYDTLRRNGRQPRALYLIPTFDNPTGRTLNDLQRREVLRLCAALHIVILEDNPYGMFRYEGDTVRAMASLDSAGCVIYLSTFSKTLAPTLRVGAATLPETLFGDHAARRALLNQLVQRKSLITINTSQISQAIVGGILLDQRCTLQEWIQPALHWYQTNRNTMLHQLQTQFSDLSMRVNWNRPQGGFFLTVELPFKFDVDAAFECAGQYGVIVMPMSFFSSDSSQDNMIRLSFSCVDPEQICNGIRFLAEYIQRRVENAA